MIRRSGTAPGDVERILIQPSKGVFHFNLGELWQYKELLYFLIWRDVKVRYKQTIIGGAWAILQPMLTMVIFTIIFGRLAKIPSDGMPYPVFTYTALLPWMLLPQALTRSGGSLVSDANLITKVYLLEVGTGFSRELNGRENIYLSGAILGMKKSETNRKFDEIVSFAEHTNWASRSTRSMIANSPVIAVVPARSGSKGIPDKNMQALGGHTLIARVGLTLKDCPSVDKAVISTDSPAYAMVNDE